MAQYVPPGWPEGVRPPGSDEWEATAVAWLLDLAPEYRQYEMVSRHPVILASIARHLIHGSVEGAREGYGTVRTELGEHAPPHAVDAALKAYRAEGRRLAAIEQAVALVEQALRGGTFKPSFLRLEPGQFQRPADYESAPVVSCQSMCVYMCRLQCGVDG